MAPSAPSPGGSRPARAFISYAHADSAFKDKFDEHTSLLRREHLIDIWCDGRVGPGVEWEPALLRNLETAELIVLLVSAAYIQSEFCWKTEMLRALERHQDGTVRVVPVILKPVDWQSTPFARLNALPKNGKPVTSWKDREAAFANVAAGIRRVLEEPGAAQDQNSAPLFAGSNVPVIGPGGPAVDTGRALLEIHVEGSLEDVERARSAIAEVIRVMTKDTTVIVRTLRGGTVTIVLELSSEGGDRLVDLVESAEITALGGFPILGLRVPHRAIGLPPQTAGTLYAALETTAAYAGLRRKLAFFFRSNSCRDAEDAADEVFLRVTRHIRKGGTIDPNLNAFSFGVARLVLKERWRAGRRTPVSIDEVGEHDLGETGAGFTKVENKVLIRELLDRISPEERELWLRYHLGDRHALARSVSLSENALRIKISRIKAKLRSHEKANGS